MPVVVLLALPHGAAAQDVACPEPLRSATRLALVVTETMNAERATLRYATRETASGAWRFETGHVPAVVGRSGLGWGYPFRRFKRMAEAVKVEGDRRTPAGFFRIGRSFGFADKPHNGSQDGQKNGRGNGYVSLKPGRTLCVDDPRSGFYNTVVGKGKVGSTTSFEDMGRVKAYRHGLFVDYPSSREKRAGSCIFIHIWSRSGRGTAGCIGLPVRQVLKMQRFSFDGAVLAILTRDARKRFGNCLAEDPAN